MNDFMLAWAMIREHTSIMMADIISCDSRSIGSRQTVISKKPAYREASKATHAWSLLKTFREIRDEMQATPTTRTLVRREMLRGLADRWQGGKQTSHRSRLVVEPLSSRGLEPAHLGLTPMWIAVKNNWTLHLASGLTALTRKTALAHRERANRMLFSGHRLWSCQ